MNLNISTITLLLCKKMTKMNQLCPLNDTANEICLLQDIAALYRTDINLPLKPLQLYPEHSIKTKANIKAAGMLSCMHNTAPPYYLLSGTTMAKEAWAEAEAEARIVDLARVSFIFFSAVIWILFNCFTLCSNNCVCFKWCPSLLEWIKKFTLDFAQFLYGPTSITLNDEESLLVISGKEFQNNRGNILTILLQNLTITYMTIVAASKIFITQVRTNECDENWLCFFTNGTQLDNPTNCSEYVNTEIVCFYIDISPLETIGVIGGFFNIATPLAFKISTSVYLSLPYYCNTKLRCRSGSCVDCAMKITLYLVYFVLTPLAGVALGINTLGLLDCYFNKVIGTISAGKLGKEAASNVIDFIAIVIMISNFPWYVMMKREGENECQCPCTRCRGYEKCAEQVPINKLSVTKIV